MLRLDLALDSGGQTAARILIQHRQHFQHTTFVRPIKNEIPSPHLVGLVRLSGQAGRYPFGAVCAGVWDGP